MSVTGGGGLSEDIAAVLRKHVDTPARRREQSRGPFVEYDRFCQCGEPLPWEPPELTAAHIAHVADAIAARLADHTHNQTHVDLVSRLGFGDNKTEPMADNDTIVDWFSERCLEANEWLEHERFRDECAAAGHDPLNDCEEHGPTCCNRTHLVEHTHNQTRLADLIAAIEALYPPVNYELRYDGTEIATNAAYVEAFREVDRALEPFRALVVPAADTGNNP